jgi:hypothetical protein
LKRKKNTVKLQKLVSRQRQCNIDYSNGFALIVFLVSGMIAFMPEIIKFLKGKFSQKKDKEE